MKRLVVLLAVVLSIVGCTTFTHNDLQWFKSKQEAIDHGIKEEGIEKQDVFGEIEDSGETFIFYKKELEEGLSVGVSSISKKDSKYAWYDSDQDYYIENVNGVSWETKTQSGKSFTIYAGLSNGKNRTINTPNGPISPNIDKETGIYYYVELSK
ncbi:hypothetical protein [Neobacillus sp.]|uniref:hypothetical protein n=1 Tax=Neobacillus sp. TaxID=2675273 RepID=UPI0035B50B50